MTPAVALGDPLLACSPARLLACSPARLLACSRAGRWRLRAGGRLGPA
ncbi:hypothetical protein [Parafrankia sp. CH37]|nr:hypothetical protein [Parafrankia sp. CH37]